MIVKFFKYGKNTKSPVKATKQAVGYLYSEQDANKEQRSIKPETVRGDPQGFSDIVAYGNHAGRYTSGVLSFAESDLDAEAQEKIIDDFEKTLLPGLEPDQYSSLWVRHRDKGRLELHFIFSGEELHTNKRLNAYYHRADIIRINAWKDAINVEYGLHDPNSPNNRNPVIYPGNLPKSRKELVEKLTEHITHVMGQGHIEPTREGILHELKSLNLEVSRETNKSISIKDPDGGQNIRLKGSFWERDFEAVRHTREAVERRNKEYDEQAQERARVARNRVNELCERRERLNRKKYAKPEPVARILPDNSPTSHIDIRNSLGRRGDALPGKQSNRNDTPRLPEPSPVPAVSRNKKPEVLPTIKKEKESDADTNRKRNNAIHEKFLERIRRKRRFFEKNIGEVHQIFISSVKQSEGNRRKLQYDNDLIRNNIEKLRILERKNAKYLTKIKRVKLHKYNYMQYPKMNYHP